MAAGESAVGVLSGGAGGEGTGGGESQGEGGEGGEIDQSLGTGQEGQGGEQEFEIDEATGEQKLDEQGNPIPKQQAAGKIDFKSIHSKLKEVDPAAADAYRKTHFGYQQYQQSFATPAEAAQAKETLETYGGVEGIEQLNGRADQFAKEMDAFSNGDPTFIAQLAKDDPEGFVKVGAPYLATLARMNPEAYDQALAPIMVSTLQSAGITDAVVMAGNAISAVYDKLKASGDTESLLALRDAFKSLQGAYNYGEKLKKIAETGAGRPLSEEAKRIQTERQQLNQEKQQSFFSEVQKTVTQASDTAIDKALQTYYKQFPKMTKDQKSDLHNGVFDYIAQQLKSNKKYMTQLRALLDNGDGDKAANFVTQNVNKLVQASARTIWNRRGFSGNLPNQQKQGAGQGNQPTGQVNLTRRPKRDDIDWDKTSEMDFLAGNAILKGTGRKVKWDWAKQE